MVYYPTLVSEIAKRGIKKSVISAKLGISARSLYNKMMGTVSFTWPEACQLQSTFFPDLKKDDLFQTSADIVSMQAIPQNTENNVLH